jgi:hypothetical protein
MDAVAWLVLSTGGLLVALNLGIGCLALSGHRAGLRTAERLIASGELDAYHAAWLLGPGYGWSRSWRRERSAAGTAVRALTAAGWVRPSPGGWRPSDEPLLPAGELDQELAVDPEHPLTLGAWRVVREAWSADRTVTVKSLTDHLAFKAACRAHAARLSGYLPTYRTRRDHRAESAPWAAGLLTAGWLTVNTCVLLVHRVQDADYRPEGGFAKFDGVLAATLGAAVLSGFVLVVCHVLAWQSWQDRWPERLRAHCRAVVEQEPRDSVPLPDGP